VIRNTINDPTVMNAPAAPRAEVADHVHVLMRPALVDARRGGRAAGLGALHDERGHLDDHVVRLVPEREEVQFPVGEVRISLATAIEDR
jgi:hypothetical protein